MKLRDDSHVAFSCGDEFAVDICIFNIAVEGICIEDHGILCGKFRSRLTVVGSHNEKGIWIVSRSFIRLTEVNALELIVGVVGALEVITVLVCLEANSVCCKAYERGLLLKGLIG